MLTLYWALRYLARGWAVMPLKPRSKEPLLKSWKEYQTRLPTKQEVMSWMSEYRSANIAILTGRQSNLVVVDVDGESGGYSLAELRIRSTTLVQTANGKHLYFLHPGSNVCNSVKKWPGIDIRGDGGYVVAPPSMHPNGRRYQWLGSSIGILSPLPGLFTGTESSSVKSMNADQGKLSALLRAIRPGNRNDTFTRLAGNLHDGRRTSGDMFSLLNPHSRACGLTDSELWSIIHSVARYQRDGSNTHIDIWSGAKHLDDFRQYCTRQPTAVDLATGFSALDASQVLRRGEIFTIGARTGVGKTTYALAVTRNLLEAGKRVLLFTTEMSRFTILDRLTVSYGESRFNRLQSINDRLFIVDKGSPTLADVQKVCQEVKPDVFLFDHIQHTGGTANSDRENISRFVRGIKDAGREFNCAVIACSQIRRLPYKGPGSNQAPILGDLKESGTIEEESSTVLLLSPLSDAYGESNVTLLADVAKNRYGPLTRFSLEFNKVNGTFKEVV